MISLHKFSMRCLLSLLCLFTATIASAQTYVSAIESGKVYRITNKNKQRVALTDDGGTNLVASTEWTDDTYNTLWTVTTSGEGYTVVNVLTGRYMQGVNGSGTQATMSATEQICYISGAGTDTYFNILPSADSNISFNLYGGKENSPIKGFGKGDNGSQWQFTEVTVTTEETCMCKFSRAVAANYGLVRLVCGNSQDRVAEAVGVQTLANKKSESVKYSQIWRLIPNGDGYLLRNMANGKYLQNVSSNDTPYPLGDEGVTLYAKPTAAEGMEATCVVISTTSTFDQLTCLHRNGSNKVVRWNSPHNNSAWLVEAAEDVAIREYEQQMSSLEALDEALDEQCGYVRFVSERDNGYVIEEDESNTLHLVPYEEGNKRQMWRVTANGAYSTIQNLATGRYIDRDMSAATSLSTNTELRTYRIDVSDRTTVAKPLFNFRHSDTENTVGWYYDGESDNLQLAETGTAEGWGFAVQPATDLLFATPTAGKIYRISNPVRPGYIIHDESNSSSPICKVTSGGDNTQFWQLVAPTEGTGYMLKNLSTGKYITFAGSRNTNYGAGDEGSTFSFTAVEGTPFYYIGETEAEGIHAGTEGNVLRFDFTDAASQWYFEEATPEELAEEFPLLSILAANDGLVRLIGNRNANKSAADINGTNTIMAARNDSKISQIWQIVPYGDGYSLQNMQSDQYLQEFVAVKTPIALADEADTYYIKPSTVKGEQFLLSSTSDYSGYTCLHDDSGNNRIVGWESASDESQWTIEAVTNITLEQIQVLKKLPEVLAANNGLVRITTDRENKYVMADGDALNFAASNADDLSQLWLMTASGSGYTLQNVQTGGYVSVPSTTQQTLTTAEASTTVNIGVSPAATVDNPLFTITNTDDTSVGVYYRSADGAVISNSTATTPGSAFVIEAAEIAAADVRTALLKADGFAVPETGKYYRIYNGYCMANNRAAEVITEKEGVLTSENMSSTNGAQVWQLTVDANGKYSFKNYSTEKYIQSQTTNVGQYATGATEVTFSVNESENSPSAFQMWYNIVDTDGDGLKMENYKVVNNSLSSETSQSNWRFKEVDINSFTYTSEHTIKTLDELINDHNGIVMVRSASRASLTKVMAPKVAEDGLYLEAMADNLTEEENWNQVWLLEKSGDTYTFRNLGSGEYIQEGLGLGESGHKFYIQASTNTTGAFNISKNGTFDDSSTGSCLNAHSEAHIGTWWAQNDTNSDWYIEPVEGITLDLVKERLDIPTYSAPESGKYYKIVSRAYGDAMSAIAGSTNINGQAYAEMPSQWWKVTGSGTSYNFQNAGYGTYIQSDPGQGALFTLGENAVSFSLAQTDDHYGIYVTSGNGGRGLHQSASQSDNIVSWSYAADASRWYFEEITLSEEEIAAKVTEFQDYLNATSDATTLSDTYLSFFTDASATTLKSNYQAMTDADLRTAMSAMPSALQNEAVKVKNNAWEAWEKKFRVADYNVSSDPNDWSGYLQVMGYGVINNPTGVVAQNGDIVYVVVGSDIPANTTVKLEARKYYDVSNGATQSITLQKGLNALPVSNDGSHIYVRYETDFGTVTKDNKASHPELANIPSLNIHIIGGQVHGYVDKAKHTDADWVSMKQNGLFWAEQTDLLGEYSIVRAQTDFITANGDQIIRLIDIYDWYVATEFDVMGLTAAPEEYKSLANVDLAYENLFPRVMNNRMVCISKKNEGGNPYGAAYHCYVPGAGNYLYENLKNKDGGSIWVFGHEWGHLNQGAINIAASNEASNNLFPNVMIHRGGYSTSRGWNVQELMRKMADEHYVNENGTYESQQGATDENYLEVCGEYSWPRTVMSWDGIGKHFTPAQMFYQLYLYYHAAGNNPLFYPRLFSELRKDPLVHDHTLVKDSNGKVTGGNQTGATDYLHFAEKACDAAGENLEDFFEAWGFFVPVKNYFMECYSQFCMTTTQDMINETLTYMRKYNKANESIIFIDDRAVDTGREATGEYSVAACKTDFVGAQYTAFNGETSQPSGLVYTTSTDSNGNTVVTIDADANVSNVAGVKFYDTAGNLVYIASQKEITIPSTLADEVDLTKTVMALADGTTMPLYNEEDEDVYILSVYVNDSISSRYTKGGDAAMLSADRDGANATAQLFTTDWSVPTNAPTTLSEANNVAVNGVFHCLNLTDKENFSTADMALSANNIIYSRTNTAGFNSVCLPFELKLDDLPDGSKIEVLHSGDDGTVWFADDVNSVAAGTPCLVWCPDNTPWDIRISESREVVAKPVDADAEDGAFTMKGSFKNDVIGPDKYKLNGAGTKFGKTTAAGKVTAFRVWMEAGTQSSANSFNIKHGGVVSDLPSPVFARPESDIIYDLSGRPVARPERGGIYIKNGRTVLIK